VFSLAPLLVVAVAVVGFVYGDEAASGEVFNELSVLVGPEVASIAEGLVSQASYGGGGWWATIFGLGTLLYGSSKVFGALQDTLNMIWRVESKKTAGIKDAIKGYALSFALVPGFGVLFLIMVISSAMVAAFGEAIDQVMAIPKIATRLTDAGFSFVFITAMFASLFKILPNKKMSWRHVLGGAAVTAALFVIGKSLIGFYLGVTTTGSVFGAAGTLAVLLMWFYLSAQIFIFGASLTHVWSRKIDEEDFRASQEAAEEE
jgi:membrane protein